MAHVFVSFVEENSKLAAWIVTQLRGNGLDVWFSKDAGRILGGDNWRTVLRNAIQEGGYYLPIFTTEWAQRERSVANEELSFAADEFRMRGPNRRWFIPLKVDASQLPHIELGGGRTLADLHYIDVPGLGWETALSVLLRSLGVENPTIEKGEPLAPGYGSYVAITGGRFDFENLRPALPEMEGMTFAVTGGYCGRRDDDKIIANFRSQAPYKLHQSINEMLGLDDIDALSDASRISTDANNPTEFRYANRYTIPAGSPMFVPGAKQPIPAPIAVKFANDYLAYGHLDGERFMGTFVASITTTALGNRQIFHMDGSFDLTIKPALQPPEN